MDDAALDTVTIRKCGIQDPERNEQDKQWKYNCGILKKIILASSWTCLAGSAGGCKGVSSHPVGYKRGESFGFPRSLRTGGRAGLCSAEPWGGLSHTSDSEEQFRWKLY